MVISYKKVISFNLICVSSQVKLQRHDCIESYIWILRKIFNKFHILRYKFTFADVNGFVEGIFECIE